MRPETMKRLVRGFLAAALLLLAGCPENVGEKEDVAKKFPVIEVSPAELCDDPLAVTACRYDFDQGLALVGETIPVNIHIRNTGERDLLVKGVTLENYKAGDGAVEDTPSLVLELPPDFQEALDSASPYFVEPAGLGSGDGGDVLTVRVVLRRPADEAPRTADLVVRSDASNNPVVKIALGTLLGFPRIQVAPEWVDFAEVGMGEIREQKVSILNTGAADLAISGFTLTGSSFYTVILQGTEYPCSPATAQGVGLDDPIVVPPGNATFFKVRFKPENDKPATAMLILYSNDPAKGEGAEVKISGNESVPCIAVNPSKLNFGGTLVGTPKILPLEVHACGEAPLVITDIHLAEGSSTDFEIDVASLPHVPSPENPLEVAISSSIVFNVTYAPLEESPLGRDGLIILDEGQLVITNNSFDKEKKVDMSGAGVPNICPTAVIKCQEGEEVKPQTVLHLFGDESFAGNGAINKWEWDVDQPVGSVSTFVPSKSFPNPTFEANVAGVYTFYLTVYDQTNTPSCFPATYEVVVIPDEALHIELLWHTPEDGDETDTGPEAGSDLDLHLLHPWAAGPDLDADGAPDGWFDIPFDCFWFNPHPNWGSYDPSVNDDPGLDRDDTDGGGPENINLDIPENQVYRVGVHYWCDHGFGPAFATIRVYVYAVLVFEVVDVKLVNKDMWSVCTVEWPSGKVTMTTDDAGGYKITPDYINPFFFSGPDC
ncbi:MAG: choice-of-anchor D domain-containing protein [Deltaproteobacteria bacterium]|nr:choice-of-anchor D domain-containing protein [Deltaproteobacteria bacterium]